MSRIYHEGHRELQQQFDTVRLAEATVVAVGSGAAASWPQAQFIVKVKVRELFPNCPRYIHKYQLVERSKFVPRPGIETPSPAWIQFDWAKDVLPCGRSG